MKGFFSLVLHAHLPFVRHPEHERSLEESWLYEAITETYVPLLQLLERWVAEGIRAPVTVTLTPTLCAMLRDPLLGSRYARHLNDLVELAEKELHRTLWEPAFQKLAIDYHARFTVIRDYYHSRRGDLIGSFRALQDAGAIEIITSSATHAVLPLLAHHLPSLRAQVFVARDQYRACFGREPRGIWLPECAYSPAVEPVLREANLTWFIVDTHGLLNGTPKPRFGTLAPVITPHGLAALGRDLTSAKQVWSRGEGYPGDPHYRDFYRDIGFDLDLDYLGPHLATPGHRTFTGIKYHRITGPDPAKAPYDRQAALRAADQHAAHFLEGRVRQMARAAELMPVLPLVVAPYDAELFGHWWYEGPEFLDLFARKAFYDQQTFQFATPSGFLSEHPSHQLCTPAESSWGEQGYWSMWLNEKTEWIYTHLQAAQERMSALVAQRRATAGTSSTGTLGGAADATLHVSLEDRALAQAGRELLLGQASDWPFIIRTGTSPGYARTRIKTHLNHFNRLYEMLSAGTIDRAWLEKVEATDNLFPELKAEYWAAAT